MPIKTNISFVSIKQNIESFKQEMEDFSMEKYPILKNQLESIKDDIELIFMESQERQDARLITRPLRNKKISLENKEGPRKEIAKFISNNTNEFLSILERKGIHIDNEANLFVGKLKKGNKVPKLFPVNFTAKPLITGDHYEYARSRLEKQAKEITEQLTVMLEAAKTKAEDVFQGYDTTSELFKKLGIPVHKVEYPFFAKEEVISKVPKKSGIHALSNGKEKSEAPTFKKIGHVMKFLLDNKIAFRANNIIEDDNQWYHFYFYQQDVTILISDVVANNSFRDPTYVIKGMVPGLKYINKEELKNYQGKRIIFNENWTMRIDHIFKEDAEKWPIIGEEKEEQNDEPQKMLTDRTTFINIIKKQFTRDTLNGASYRVFVEEYNKNKDNKLLLNETIYGNASLLGLGGKKTMQDIKKAIFELTKPKLEIPENSYFSNAYIQKSLLAIQSCEGFDIHKVSGCTNYCRWMLEVLRKAYKAEFVDDIKNKSMKEKKEKLEEYLGVKDVPLFAQKITSMLGGRVRSVDTEYQKMLRKRFSMNHNKETALQDYKRLQQEILKYETKREDETLHPNAIKSDRKISQKRGETPTTDKIEKVVSKHDIALYQVKKAIVLKEYPAYRALALPGYDIDLRLYKGSTATLTDISIGRELKVFATNRGAEEPYITVNIEKVSGDHKVAEFRDTHDDSLINGIFHGKKCPAVINNIDGKYMYVSLTKSYSGRMTRNFEKNDQRGDSIKVTFDRIIEDTPGRRIVKLR